MLFTKKKNQLNFLNQSPFVQHKGRELEINSWVVSEFVVEKLIPIVGVSPFPINELFLMVSTVLITKPKYIFEWGTHIGKSARIFYEIVDHFKLDCKIYSVDLPDNVDHVEHPKSQRGTLVKDIKDVTLIQGDGVVEALKIYNKKPMTSLFFLDGDHEYKSVKRELELLNNSVDKPAILAHDTFYQTEESEYNIGPHKAVEEFLKKNKKFRKVEFNLGLPGMTLLLPHSHEK